MRNRINKFGVICVEVTKLINRIFVELVKAEVFALGGGEVFPFSFVRDRPSDLASPPGGGGGVTYGLSS